MKKAAKVFLIIGMVTGFYLIVPIIIGVKTLHRIDTYKKPKELLGWGIASIILVNLLGGLFTLLLKEEDLAENPLPRARKRFNFRGSLCMPYAVFMALFVIFPLLLIVYYAFTDSSGAFSLYGWKEVFTSSSSWKVIGMTFVVSTFTTIVCLLIAYPIAYILSNSKFNKNRIFVYIFLFPMWINFVIRTLALKDLLTNFTNSVFGWNITSKYPYVSIVIGMVYDYLPFAILPLYNQMLKMDKNQIEAAADLGANPAQVFVKNIIPMTIPGIVSACMMTFMPTMSSFVIAYHMSNGKELIIGSLIDLYINSSGANGYNVGSVLSLVMLVIVGSSLVIQKIADKKEAAQKENLW